MSRKELRSNIEDALTQILETYQIQGPSKKAAKIIIKSSKKVSRQLHAELKRELKKTAKPLKKTAKPDKKILVAAV